MLRAILKKSQQTPPIDRKGLQLFVNSPPNSPTGKRKKIQLTVHQQGFMKRKKEVLGNWKTYWFVIEGNFLMEFSTSKENEKSRRVINLSRCTLKYNPSIRGYPKAFKLIVSNYHSMMFKVQDDDQLVSWLCTFRKFCAKSEIEWFTSEVLQAFSDGIAIVSDKGMILQANDALLSMFALPSRATIIGEKLDTLMGSETDHFSIDFKSMAGTTKRFTACRKDDTHFPASAHFGEYQIHECRHFTVTFRRASLPPTPSPSATVIPEIEALPTQPILVVEEDGEKRRNSITQKIKEVLIDEPFKLLEGVRSCASTETVPAVVTVAEETPTEGKLEVIEEVTCNYSSQDLTAGKVSLSVLIMIALAVFQFGIPFYRSMWSVSSLLVSLGFFAVSIALLHMAHEYWSERYVETTSQGLFGLRSKISLTQPPHS